MIRLFLFVILLFPLLRAEINFPDSLIRVSGDTVWYDARCFTIEGKGWTDTDSTFDRLPLRAKDLVPEKVWRLSRNSAGISVDFSTDSKFILVNWTLNNAMISLPHMPATGVSGVDLYRRTGNDSWIFVGNGRPSPTLTSSSVFKDSLKEKAESDYILYLPLYNGVKKLEIGIPKDKNISPAGLFNKEKLPILFYGTSITQGGCASRPGLVHTSIVQRKLNNRVINLGFSGSGKMEIEMAHLISEVDASLYILDCLWNMTDELVRDRVEPFVRYLRSKRPETPILLVEDSKYNYSSPSPKSKILMGIYEKMQKEGLENIYFLEGKELLGSDGEGTVDGVHPNDIGFQRHAKEFIRVIKGILE